MYIFIMKHYAQILEQFDTYDDIVCEGAETESTEIETFTPTVAWMKETYDRLNDEVFHGRAPKSFWVKFSFSRSKSYLGQARCKFGRKNIATGKVEMWNFEIVMSLYRRGPEWVALGTMAHEMIHIIDYYENSEHFICYNPVRMRWERPRPRYDSHGKWFMSFAPTLKEHGIILGRRASEEEMNALQFNDKTASGKQRLAYMVFLVQRINIVGGTEISKHKGWFFRVGSPDTFFKLRNSYDSHNDEDHTGWALCQCDLTPTIASMSKCVSRLNGWRISWADFKAKYAENRDIHGKTIYINNALEKAIDDDKLTSDLDESRVDEGFTDWLKSLWSKIKELFDVQTEADAQEPEMDDEGISMC